MVDCNRAQLSDSRRSDCNATPTLAFNLPFQWLHLRLGNQTSSTNEISTNAHQFEAHKVPMHHQPAKCKQYTTDGPSSRRLRWSAVQRRCKANEPKHAQHSCKIHIILSGIASDHRSLSEHAAINQCPSMSIAHAGKLKSSLQPPPTRAAITYVSLNHNWYRNHAVTKTKIGNPAARDSRN